MKNSNPIIFEEGSSYPFIVTGKIVLPPDDEEFLILNSNFGSRHLLKYEPYKHYGLKKNTEVNCRIDKINCSGKMFLEPEHKDYKEGNIYSFRINGFEEILNSDEQAERFLQLTDANNQDVYVNIGKYSPRDFSEAVKCRVDRIKKGKLYLTLAETTTLISRLEAGKIYEFLIISIQTLAEDEEYYMLQDELGETHYLRKKFYEDYGFNIDDTIRCRVLHKPHQLFRHYLEPEHPYYKTGETYPFLVTGIEHYTNEFDMEVTKLVVIDSHEKEYFADCSNHTDSLPEIGATIVCKVDNIRMSKLILMCV